MDAALGSWVPPSVVGAILVFLLGFTWKILSSKATDLVNEVKAIRSDLNSIDKKLGTYATTESLGRMGDRFDSRIQAQLERVVVLEREIAILKEREESLTKGRKRKA